MEAVGKDDVHHQVEDWKKRISDLYDFVERQSKNDRTLRFDRTHTIMREEMMERYGYGSEEIPVLDIFRKNKLLATFQPVGLWVIGANGRVDVLTKDGAHILVDLSNEDEPPKWIVYSPKNRKTGKPLDADFVREILQES